MKYAMLGLGFVTALAIWLGPHYTELYAAKGLPPKYEGPKYRHWRNGVEIT